MKKLHLSLIISCFFITTTPKADLFGDISSIIDQVTAAIKTYQESDLYKNNDQYRELMARKQAEDLRIKLINVQREMTLSEHACPGCPSVSNLTRAVNKIIRKISDDKPTIGSLAQEVGTLEAMYYINQSTTDSKKCSHEMLSTSACEEDIERHRNFDLLFTKQINFHNVGAMQISKDNNRYYYYKAEIDGQEVIIRVDVMADGTGFVSYYVTEKPSAIIPTSQNIAPSARPPNDSDLYKTKRDNIAVSPLMLSGFQGLQIPFQTGRTDEAYFRGNLSAGIPRGEDGVIQFFQADYYQNFGPDPQDIDHLKGDLYIKSNMISTRLTLEDDEQGDSLFAKIYSPYTSLGITLGGSGHISEEDIFNTQLNAETNFTNFATEFSTTSDQFGLKLNASTSDFKDLDTKITVTIPEMISLESYVNTKDFEHATVGVKATGEKSGLSGSISYNTADVEDKVHLGLTIPLAFTISPAGLNISNNSNIGYASGTDDITITNTFEAKYAKTSFKAVTNATIATQDGRQTKLNDFELDFGVEITQNDSISVRYDFADEQFWMIFKHVE